MNVVTHPMQANFVAEIAGVDLTQPVDIDAIWSVIDRYAVVVFRDQRLTDTQLRDFAARFGPLEIGRAGLERSAFEERLHHRFGEHDQGAHGGDRDEVHEAQPGH